MKYKIKILTILAFSCIFAAISCTQKVSEPIETGSDNAAEKHIYNSTGVVKAIDHEKSKITIDHEDIPGYMPPMEMTEPVSDPKVLELFKPGDKIEFELERIGSKLLITKMTKIGEVSLIEPAEIYKINCAECHGADGKGEKKGIPLDRGHALHQSEADFIKTVTNGKDRGKAKKMPPFNDKLNDQEIAAVVRYIREEFQSKRSPEKSGAHSHSH